MESTGIVPTMPIGGTGYGFGDSGIWLFAILALMFGGFGGGYGGGLGYRAATAEDVSSGFNFSELQAENRDILASIERNKADIVSDIHDVAMNVADTRAHQQECCCNILRAIDATNYNTTQQVQKILDAMSANKIEELQGKVSQLELAQALNGVVRYPSAYTYNAGPSPFCPGTGCNGNI